MFSPKHDFFTALNKARKSARRNDICEAERWLKVAERHVAMAERLKKLTTAETAPARPPWLRGS